MRGWRVSTPVMHVHLNASPTHLNTVLLKASKHSDDPRGYICKVADLGLSRWFGDDNLKTHTITCTLGTMAYQVCATILYMQSSPQ